MHGTTYNNNNTIELNDINALIGNYSKTIILIIYFLHVIRTKLLPCYLFTRHTNGYANNLLYLLLNLIQCVNVRK